MRVVITKLSLTFMFASATLLYAQSGAEKFSFDPNAAGLDATQRIEFEAALRRQNYKQAETILMNEINKNPTTIAAGKMLVNVAGIFFLDNDFLNAAIAYKKAEKIAPLEERHRFTLAMAYLKLKRADWAAAELTKLVKENPYNPLFLYWLARIDYDEKKYPEAIAKLNRVIDLDPKMMRAYDNLGLCYEHLSDTENALKNYRKAIDLNRVVASPSPWPPTNLAVMLIGKNELSEAESLLREAMKYDENIPQVHYNLGQIFDKQNKPAAAIAALQKAVALDAHYAEPHYTLSRVYQRQGDKDNAQKSLAAFQRLKKAQ